MAKQKPIKQPVEDSSFDFDKQKSTEVVTFKFSKEQLVASKKYSLHRDVLNALLEDGKVFTFDEVDQKLNDFLKGKVKQ